MVVRDKGYSCILLIELCLVFFYEKDVESNV